MNCYGRPLCSTSSSVKLLQHEGAPQIVANKQELVRRRDATSFQIEHCVTDARASPQAPGFIVTVRQWGGHATGGSQLTGGRLEL